MSNNGPEFEQSGSGEPTEGKKGEIIKPEEEPYKVRKEALKELTRGELNFLARHLGYEGKLIRSKQGLNFDNFLEAVNKLSFHPEEMVQKGTKDEFLIKAHIAYTAADLESSKRLNIASSTIKKVINKHIKRFDEFDKVVDKETDRTKELQKGVSDKEAYEKVGRKYQALMIERKLLDTVDKLKETKTEESGRKPDEVGRLLREAEKLEEEREERKNLINRGRELDLTITKDMKDISIDELKKMIDNTEKATSETVGKEKKVVFSQPPAEKPEIKTPGLAEMPTRELMTIARDLGLDIEALKNMGRNQQVEAINEAIHKVVESQEPETPKEKLPKKRIKKTITKENNMGSSMESQPAKRKPEETKPKTEPEIESVPNIKKEIFERAGERSSEEVSQLIKDVDEIFKNEKEKGKGKLADTIEEIKKGLHGGEYFVDGHIAYLPKGGEAIFVGDTHGDPEATASIVEQSQFIERVEKGEKVYLVFLGDYADRGTGDIKNLEQVLALKKEFSNNVILMRGNHEEKEIGKQPQHDSEGNPLSYLLESLRESDKYDKGEGKKLFDEYNELFEKMPGVVVTGNGIVAVHGGISNEDIGSLKDLNDPKKLEQMRWNDPKKRAVSGRFRSDRWEGAIVFGKAPFDKFMNTIKANVMIRGHQTVEGGAETIFGDKLATVFSSGGEKSERSGYKSRVKFPKYAVLSLEDPIEELTPDMFYDVEYRKSEEGELTKPVPVGEFLELQGEKAKEEAEAEPKVEEEKPENIERREKILANLNTENLYVLATMFSKLSEDSVKDINNEREEVEKYKVMNRKVYDEERERFRNDLIKKLEPESVDFTTEIDEFIQTELNKNTSERNLRETFQYFSDRHYIPLVWRRIHYDGAGKVVNKEGVFANRTHEGILDDYKEIGEKNSKRGRRVTGVFEDIKKGLEDVDRDITDSKQKKQSEREFLISMDQEGIRGQTLITLIRSIDKVKGELAQERKKALEEAGIKLKEAEPEAEEEIRKGIGPTVEKMKGEVVVEGEVEEVVEAESKVESYKNMHKQYKDDEKIKWVGVSDEHPTGWVFNEIDKHGNEVTVADKQKLISKYVSTNPADKAEWSAKLTAAPEGKTWRDYEESVNDLLGLERINLVADTDKDKEPVHLVEAMIKVEEQMKQLEEEGELSDEQRESFNELLVSLGNTLKEPGIEAPPGAGEGEREEEEETLDRELDAKRETLVKIEHRRNRKFFTWLKNKLSKEYKSEGEYGEEALQKAEQEYIETLASNRRQRVTNYSNGFRQEGNELVDGDGNRYSLEREDTHEVLLGLVKIKEWELENEEKERYSAAETEIVAGEKGYRFKQWAKKHRWLRAGIAGGLTAASIVTASTGVLVPVAIGLRVLRGAFTGASAAIGSEEIMRWGGEKLSRKFGRAQAVKRREETSITEEELLKKWHSIAEQQLKRGKELSEKERGEYEEIGRLILERRHEDLDKIISESFHGGEPIGLDIAKASIEERYLKEENLQRRIIGKEREPHKEAMRHEKKLAIGRWTAAVAIGATLGILAGLKSPGGKKPSGKRIPGTRPDTGLPSEIINRSYETGLVPRPGLSGGSSSDFILNAIGQKGTAYNLTKSQLSYIIDNGDAHLLSYLKSLGYNLRTIPNSFRFAFDDNFINNLVQRALTDPAAQNWSHYFSNFADRAFTLIPSNVNII